MPGPVLYSVNPWLKHYIQAEWRGGIHYVWCSDVWDGGQLSQLERGSFVAPSSNPVDIYRELEQAVERRDQHCARIRELGVRIKGRATEWWLKGEITEHALQEIIALADSPDLRVWRPYVYIIPRGPVSARLETVPFCNRAGTAIEYRIADLRTSEFDPIKL